MQAIVEIAAQQFPVRVGEILVVPRLHVEVGTTVDFDRILLIEDASGVHVGTPYIEGIVRAEVLEHGKGRKVLVFKKKRRKGYKRLKGHRQSYTRIRIVGIELHERPTAG
ncbi:MAG: 50S ribosomal protein L21 [Candidatus Kapabacteria bacterium]|nr:50S ribosomal protein L21 [Candidatus Kapabacteria bacterium]MDW8012901.1 50S ribosomal protein L21 [Bacteroidota bacterium]